MKKGEFGFIFGSLLAFTAILFGHYRPVFQAGFFTAQIAPSMLIENTSNSLLLPLPQMGSARIYRTEVGARAKSASEHFTTNVAWVDTVGGMLANPADFSNLPVGAHTAFTADAIGYAETAGICTYTLGDAECNISVFALTPQCTGVSCSVPLPITANTVTKVTFLYTQTAP
jgi:hypothetical protein